jgi:uncharacterized protein YchJ
MTNKFSFSGTATAALGDDPKDKAACQRHKRNMAALRTVFPDVHKKLSRFKPASRLVRAADGGVDVAIGGGNYFGRGCEDLAAGQIKEPWTVSDRINVDFFLFEHTDPPALDFKNRLVRRLADTDMAFLDQVRDEGCFHLIVLGVGLGFHLDALMEKTACSMLFLFEPNLELLYQSTFTYDWCALLERSRARDIKIDLCLSDDPAFMTDHILEIVRKNGPFVFEGMTIFLHDKTPILQGAWDLLSQKKWLFYSAMGFFDDEVFMVCNSHGNLVTRDSRFFTTAGSGIPAPVFIVGGGPSKDVQYDFLRANKDKAVVISCGSALESLLSQGITPDFHFIMERSSTVYDMMKLTAGERDLSGICLVASTTIDLRVADLFDQTVFFFRENFSSYPIFSAHFDGEPVKNCDPHVANAAFSFAQMVGFRTFYLFGLDMGSRDPELHHAKGSWPMRANEVDFDIGSYSFDESIPGNFGGTVYSNYILIFARDMLQKAIDEFYKGLTYFNCSDGGLIPGTTPKRIADVSLGDIPGGKGPIVANLFASFTPVEREPFSRAWRDYDIRRRTNDFRDNVAACLKANPRLADQAYVREMSRLLNPEGPDLATAMLFRGTLTFILIAAAYCLNHLEDVEHQEALETILVEEIITALDRLHGDALLIIDGLEAGNPNAATCHQPADRSGENVESETARLRRAVGKTADYAAAPGGGQVARNAPCPCGSGAKFKHCHGRIA